MKLFSFKKRRLFDILRESVNLTRANQKKHLVEYMLNELRKVCPEELYDRGASIVRSQVSRFCSKFYERWEKCGKTYSLFLSNNADWLNGDIVFELSASTNAKKQVKIGRPSKSFITLATRSKRRKTETLREKHSSVELLHAAATQFRSEGDEQVAKLLLMLCSDPQMAADILNAYKMSENLTLPVKLRPKQGVSLIIEADLSKAQYLLIRSVAKNHLADVFPSYDAILEAKQRAYPTPTPTPKLHDIPV